MLRSECGGDGDLHTHEHREVAVNGQDRTKGSGRVACVREAAKAASWHRTGRVAAHLTDCKRWCLCVKHNQGVRCKVWCCNMLSCIAPASKWSSCGIGWRTEQAGAHGHMRVVAAIEDAKVEHEAAAHLLVCARAVELECRACVAEACVEDERTRSDVNCARQLEDTVAVEEFERLHAPQLDVVRQAGEVARAQAMHLSCLPRGCVREG